MNSSDPNFAESSVTTPKLITFSIMGRIVAFGGSSPVLAISCCDYKLLWSPILAPVLAVLTSYVVTCVVMSCHMLLGVDLLLAHILGHPQNVF